MNAIVFSFLAAGCAATANFFFRRNSAASQGFYSSKGYLVLFYLFSFISSFLFYPNIWKTEINYIVIFLGGTVGLLNVFLMYLTSQALRKGPAGLTFAFQNASAVFPGVFLFLLFGSDFGFLCSSFQILGIMLVLIGLFVGAKDGSPQSKASFEWLQYVLACFAVQILALTCMQGRCILFDTAKFGDALSTLSITEAQDLWFMPAQFGVSFLIQLIAFLKENRRFNRLEAYYGFMGGLANFASTCLLLLATKFAHTFEKGILFPCFAVSTIIFCNLWANRFYKERFNLASNALCSLGIFLGVVA